MRKVILDIETVSAANLPKVGALNYARHPSTFISIICWKYTDEDKIIHWISPKYITRQNPNIVKLLEDVQNNKVKLICHNASFERHLLNAEFGVKLRPSHFVDTMVLSNIH